MKHPTQEQQLGNAIKQIRNSLRLPTDWVAHKLQYADKSTYCKLERGEIKNISIWLLLDICELFDCNIVQLFFLAGIDIFKTKIKTWAEFTELVLKNDEENFNQIYKLLPPPIKEKNKFITSTIFAFSLLLNVRLVCDKKDQHFLLHRSF